MDSSDSCPVCLETIKSHFATLDPCKHIYCWDCSLKWLQTKHTCPLCSGEIKKVVHVKDGATSERSIETFKIVDPLHKHKTDVNEFAQCFDHEYFKEELKKLKKRCDDSIFNVTKLRKRSDDDEIKLDCLYDIRDLLLDLIDVMTYFEPFSAEDVLSQLYDCDVKLTAVATNQLDEIRQIYKASTSTTTTTTAVYADDSDYGDYDYKAFESLSKKMNVKVVKKNGKKKK